MLVVIRFDSNVDAQQFDEVMIWYSWSGMDAK